MGGKLKHLIIDNDKCIGCGLCKQVCIRDNIEIVDNEDGSGNDGACSSELSDDEN